MTFNGRIRRSAFAAIVLALVGCSGGNDPDDAVALANATNIQRLSNLYNGYQTRNEMRGPADEAKFREFVSGLEPDTLKRIGVEGVSVDELFKSERDGQPFKIRYGVPGSMMGSNAPVVFESTGVGGKRQVGSLDMTTREVDAAEYDQLWEGKAAPAAPARDQKAGT